MPLSSVLTRELLLNLARVSNCNFSNRIVTTLTETSTIADQLRSMAQVRRLEGAVTGRKVNAPVPVWQLALSWTQPTNLDPMTKKPCSACRKSGQRVSDGEVTSPG